MIAYKLFKIRKDGSIGSLFINLSEKYELNQWMVANPYPTKGFAFRQGFHCLLKPEAPHLKMELASGEKRAFLRLRLMIMIFLLGPNLRVGNGFWLRE